MDRCPECDVPLIPDIACTFCGHNPFAVTAEAPPQALPEVPTALAGAGTPPSAPEPRAFESVESFDPSAFSAGHSGGPGGPGAPPLTPTEVAETFRPDESNERNKKVMMLAGAGLGVLLLLVGGFTILTGGGSDETAPEVLAATATTAPPAAVADRFWCRDPQPLPGAPAAPTSGAVESMTFVFSDTPSTMDFLSPGDQRLGEAVTPLINNPTNPSALIACLDIDEGQWYEVHRCSGYEIDGRAGGTVVLEEANWQLRVYEAATGELVQESPIPSLDKTCPQVALFQGGSTRTTLEAEPDTNVLLNALSEVSTVAPATLPPIAPACLGEANPDAPAYEGATGSVSVAAYVASEFYGGSILSLDRTPTESIDEAAYAQQSLTACVERGPLVEVVACEAFDVSVSLWRHRWTLEVYATQTGEQVLDTTFEDDAVCPESVFIEGRQRPAPRSEIQQALLVLTDPTAAAEASAAGE